MAAQLQSPSPSQLPPTQNRAPLKPLLELKRGGKKPSSRIAAALKERFQHFHRRDRDVFREIVNVGWLINLFANGQQFPVRNPVTGAWGALPLSGNHNSDQRALNIMRNVVTNLLGKWENSSPDILIRPGRNLDTCVSAAKAADTINNFYERQFYNHWFTQQEGLMGMTFGTYIDRYRYDESKVSMSVIQDIFETKDAQLGNSFGYCADCEYGGDANGFQPSRVDTQESLGALGGEGPLTRRGQCPECGSTAVRIEGAAQGRLSSVVGQQQRQVGDLVCELLPLPACRWDLTRRPEDSSWFIYRQTIPKGAVNRVLGNVLLPQGNTDADYGLETLRALGMQGSALSGFSAYGTRRSGDRDDARRGEECTFDEMWLSPDDYADINLIGDEETIEGPAIPAGKLTDVFPDGLCAVGLNGMAVVLALYPEQHRKHIVSGTWFMQTATGAGRGLADSVEVQKQFNTGNNQAASYMAATYSPAIGYDNQLISGNKMKYLGTPRTNIPFDLTKLPEGRSMKDAIFQFAPTAMPNQFFNYFQDFLGYLMKKTSGASDYDQGEPGIAPNNPTATAAEIDQGNADSFNQPIFLIKADARRRGAELTIELFRQHFPMKRYFDLGGKFGEQQGIELSAADIQADLVYEVARNSEMPKGPYQRQKNLMQFFNVVKGGDGYAMLQQADPKLADEIKQIFDVDLQPSDFDAVAELCRKRLNQMVQAARLGVTDPARLIEAIQPPISAKEPRLADKGKWFASWLDTDEGQRAPMTLRAAAELLSEGQIAGQTQQDVEVATQQGMVQAAAMAPAALGGAALEQQAQQPESTEPDPTAQMQFEQELTQQRHEASESAKDRKHEMALLDKEAERDKDVSKAETADKIRLERSKPRPKPAAKIGAKKK
jgi:hypothetical protein